MSRKQSRRRAEYPFFLTTGRLVHHFHTRTKTGRAEKLQAASLDAFVQIAPEDATHLRLRDGGYRARFEALKGRAEALCVIADPLVTTNRIRINTLALGARLPTMHGFRELAEAAGLMSYGPSFLDLYRRSGDYVDKILRGIKPADIPVEQPTKFDLVINLTTAKALGLEIPSTLLARADEVIE